MTEIKKTSKALPPERATFFEYTRTFSEDYRFTQGYLSESDQDVITALTQYERYLINGYSYFSFPAGKHWISAKLERGSEYDNRSRPILKLCGSVTPISNIGDYWLTFAAASSLSDPARDLRKGVEISPLKPGIYRGDQSSLEHFLHLLSQREKPTSWAFGSWVEKLQGCDYGFEFQVVNEGLVSRDKAKSIPFLPQSKKLVEELPKEDFPRSRLTEKLYSILTGSPTKDEVNIAKNRFKVSLSNRLALYLEKKAIERLSEREQAERISEEVVLFIERHYAPIWGDLKERQRR